jgi:hypothetical protein
MDQRMQGRRRTLGGSEWQRNVGRSAVPSTAFSTLFAFCLRSVHERRPISGLGPVYHEYPHWVGDTPRNVHIIQSLEMTMPLEADVEMHRKQDNAVSRHYDTCYTPGPR